METFGFRIEYERAAASFVFLTLGGVALMLEGLDGNTRHWRVADTELVRPLGRGVNFQWDVVDIENMYRRVQAWSPTSIYLALETRSYARHRDVAIQKQFVVEDPDGYLFRFCEDVT